MNRGHIFKSVPPNNAQLPPKRSTKKNIKLVSFKGMIPLFSPFVLSKWNTHELYWEGWKEIKICLNYFRQIHNILLFVLYSLNLTKAFGRSQTFYKFTVLYNLNLVLIKIFHNHALHVRQIRSQFATPLVWWKWKIIEKELGHSIRAERNQLFTAIVYCQLLNVLYQSVTSTREKLPASNAMKTRQGIVKFIHLCSIYIGLLHFVKCIYSAFMKAFWKIKYAIRDLAIGHKDYKGRRACCLYWTGNFQVT